MYFGATPNGILHGFEGGITVNIPTRRVSCLETTVAQQVARTGPTRPRRLSGRSDPQIIDEQSARGAAGLGTARDADTEGHGPDAAQVDPT